MYPNLEMESFNDAATLGTNLKKKKQLTNIGPRSEWEYFDFDRSQFDEIVMNMSHVREFFNEGSENRKSFSSYSNSENSSKNTYI